MANALLIFIEQHATVTLLGAITILQISPIKVDPWSLLAKVIKKWLVGDIIQRLNELSQSVSSDRVANKRWFILDFANSCLQGRRHTKEEWEHVIDEISWYDDFCRDNDIPNGRFEENAKYLRATYQKLLKEKDFL